MNSFLMDEYRDGFYVDRRRKALWKIELDIMSDIDRVCRKHSISYCVLGGALIGAVRHHGFIPWDDDMDIGMLREDYDRFLKIARDELDKRFEIQEGTKDPECYDIITRIRDKESTGVLRRDVDRNCNNGVFIEIYPLDGVNPNNILLKLQLFRFRVLNDILHFSCYPEKANLKKRVETLVAKTVTKIVDKQKIYNQLHKVISKYSGKGYEYVDILVTRYNCKYRFADIKKTIRVPYEYCEFTIPEGYDHCLKTTYGDYMVLPPEEKRVEHHNKVVYYDPFHPYTDESVKMAAREYFSE